MNALCYLFCHRAKISKFVFQKCSPWKDFWKESFIIPLLFENHRKSEHTSVSHVYAWAMNQTNEFCQAIAKFIPSFYRYFFPLLILLHFLSSFILKLIGWDANQVPEPSQKTNKNQAMKSKAKVMLDEFVFQWKKGGVAHSLMVCNCNSAWCLRISYDRGGNSKKIAAVSVLLFGGERERFKAKRVG